MAPNEGCAREGRCWRAASHRRCSLLPLGCRGDNVVDLAFSQPVQDVDGSGVWDQCLIEQRVDEIVSAGIVPALLVEWARKAGHGGTIV